MSVSSMDSYQSIPDDLCDNEDCKVGKEGSRRKCEKDRTLPIQARDYLLSVRYTQHTDPNVHRRFDRLVNRLKQVPFMSRRADGKVRLCRNCHLTLKSIMHNDNSSFLQGIPSDMQSAFQSQTAFNFSPPPTLQIMTQPTYIPTSGFAMPYIYNLTTQYQNTAPTFQNEKFYDPSNNFMFNRPSQFQFDDHSPSVVNPTLQGMYDAYLPLQAPFLMN